ncbi:uncharacterized protein LOC144700547 [Wolffia australiana]
MDPTSESHDAFADLNPLPSVYMSDGPVSVSLESLFSMDQEPSQVGLLTGIETSMSFATDMGMPHFPGNPSLIQMEPSPRAIGSAGKLMLQKAPLSCSKPQAHTTFLPTFKLPLMEGLTVSHTRGPRTKRKPPSEKPIKPQIPAVVTVTTTAATKPLKSHNEILDTVRSKLRESLSSALALVTGEKPMSPMETKSPDSGDAASPCLRDDLLQENGLSWARLGPGEDPIRALAAGIETELFRLFGGVNKKYKEKARSLLFNLKDLSNPELRTRVVRGDITAQRLCAMSAEELASKELSEWRMAKAEELGKMVVLQDADVDLRRMVRKTHKGEVQLEVDDDSTSVEVAVGSNTLPLIMAQVKVNAKLVNDPCKKEEDAGQLSETPVESVAKELLPIVSLGELMGAVDSELPATATAEPSPSPSAVEPSPSPYMAMVKKEGHIWEGMVQLSVSSLTTVLAFFKSGERASTKDWPAIVEVKGRVRVEAFEKFLRDLPLSKSRAVMVLDLQWKEGSSEGSQKALFEAAESYEADGRLGYVEPCPGVELYVCPAGGKTAKMVAGEGDDGGCGGGGEMVGIVVWRRAMVESPRVHHPKHASSKRSSLSKKQQRLSLAREAPPPEDDVPPGFGPGSTARAGEDDDLPEFDFRGAAAAAPERPATTMTTTTTTMTTTVAAAAAAAPSPPGYHMRELIQKYGGQMGAKRPWEDDDDIPEWQPQRAAVAPPPPWTFAGGDQRNVMDWRYDVNRSRGF